MRLINIGKFLAIASAITMGSFASHAMATTIANWTFETSQPVTAGPLSPEVGAGAASGIHAGAAVYSTPAGNGSVHSFSANTWAIGDSWQFKASTVGLQNIKLEFDMTSSNTGPKDFKVQYSSDGSTYTDLPSGSFVSLPNGIAPPPAFWGVSAGRQTGYIFNYDFSSITALNNDANAAFRLVLTTTNPALATSAFGASGANRVDNVTISGEVPEPSTIALLAMAGVALVSVRRRIIG
jgi:hypothetical protein